MIIRRTLVTGLIVLSLSAAALADNLRVATWNVTTFDPGDTRASAFQAAIYGSFQGRSLAPDLFLVQEFNNSAAADTFLSLLNSAPGSPGDWAMAPFVEIGPLDNATFYRTSRVGFLGATQVNATSGPGDQPRDTIRYDVQIMGTGEKIGLYNLHMRAGSGTSDQALRQIEADRIRQNAAGLDTNGAGTGLPAGYHFLLAGDLNMGSANQEAWGTFTSLNYSPLAPGAGQFTDPINATGTWSGVSTNRRIQTNDPRTGIDDRFDLFGLSSSLVDGIGTDYVGLAGVPFSTLTWDDPNHSYRVWGNDGQQAIGGPMTLSGNEMVGDLLAQALLDASPATGGHLPVFLDLSFSSSAAAPEPGTLGLLALAGAGAWTTVRRGKNRRKTDVEQTKTGGRRGGDNQNRQRKIN